ncbi:AsmA family protein [Litoribacter populi]|uniref:hypothetical protein n=1 Tax=Litoribacter populi TaxID=2598460 RepID=UPI00118118B6|nr:hypothetical protein [Litoribacter populi]
MSILRKTLKIVGFILVGIMLLLLVAGIIIDPIAKNMMVDQINEADQGQYSAQIDNVNISLLWGNVVVNGVRIQTDTAVARENETPVIDFQAKELSIRGLSYFNYLLRDKVDVGEIAMLDLVVEAKVRTVGDDDDEDAGPFRWEDLDIYPMIKDQVDRVRLRDITFGNIDLTLINIDTDDTLFFDAEQFHVNTDDILIDADRVFTDGRAFFASRIDIDGKDIHVIRSGLNPYEIGLGVIEFETRESDFGMLSENAYFFKKGTSPQDTVFFALAEKFDVNELDLNRVQEDSVASIQSILLDGMRVINNMEVEEEEVKQGQEQTPDINLGEFTLGDFLPELLDKVKITTISLQNIDFRQKEDIEVWGIGFESRDMVIDKVPAFRNERFLHAEEFKFSIDTLSFYEPDQMMHLGFSDLKLDIENGVGDFGLNNIQAKYTERKQGELFAQAKLSGFNITGIDTRELYERIFAIDSISIEYPQLYVDMGGMANEGEQNAETPQEEIDLDFYPAIEEYLREFRINKIALIEANISVDGLEENGETARLPAVYAQVSDLHIAEGNAFAGSRFMHADDIALRLERIDFPLPEDAHRIELDLFRMSTREGFIRANGFKYGHGGDHEEVLDEGDMDQVFTITNKYFSIENLSFSRLMKDEFIAGSINLNGLGVEIFGEIPEAVKEASEEAAKEAEKEIENMDLMEISEYSMLGVLPEGMKRLAIGRISLEDINLQQEDLVKLKGFGFSVEEFVVDQRPAFAENRFLHTKALELTIDSLNYIEPVEDIQFALEDFKFAIDNGKGEFGIHNIKAKHKEDHDGDMELEAEVDAFKITGINTQELMDRKFSIDSISIDYPKIIADLGGMGEENDEAETDEEDMDLDFYPAIKDYLDELQIYHFALKEADISLAGLSDDMEMLGQLPMINLRVTDIKIAEGTAFQNSKILHADDIALRMEDIDMPLPDNVHRVKLDLLDISTGERYLQADGFLYDYNENYPKIMEGPETNMVFKARNEKFLIEGLDFSQAMSLEGVFADAITIDGLDVGVFLDNNFPAEESEEELPATIQKLIMDIEMPIYLGDFTLNNGHITYEELAEGGEVPGKFTLEELFVNMDNVTNVDEKIAENSETRINLDAHVMGEGHFQAQLSIPMHDEYAKARFSGDIDSLNLVALNRYTEYTSLFGFESGMIYTLRWDFNAGNDHAAGIFGLSYENLSIQLSESDSPDPAGVIFQIGAYLANALVLDEDKSEDKSDPPKKVDFDRQKEEDESFIDHYIASLMAGFIEIMGFPLNIIDP